MLRRRPLAATLRHPQANRLDSDPVPRHATPRIDPRRPRSGSLPHLRPGRQPRRLLRIPQTSAQAAPALPTRRAHVDSGRQIYRRPCIPLGRPQQVQDIRLPGPRHRAPYQTRIGLRLTPSLTFTKVCLAWPKHFQFRWDIMSPFGETHKKGHSLRYARNASISRSQAGPQPTCRHRRSRTHRKAHLQLRPQLSHHGSHQGRHGPDGSAVRTALYFPAHHQRHDHHACGLPRRQVRQPLGHHAPGLARHDGHILLPARQRAQLLAAHGRDAARRHRPLPLPLPRHSFPITKVPRQARLRYLPARNGRQRRRGRRPRAGRRPDKRHIPRRLHMAGRASHQRRPRPLLRHPHLPDDAQHTHRRHRHRVRRRILQLAPHPSAPDPP